MSETISNISFIIPKGLSEASQKYQNQANHLLAEFIEEINEQNGTVTVIVPQEGHWYFDFADISRHLSDQIIARLESNGYSADTIKAYAAAMRGY